MHVESAEGRGTVEKGTISVQLVNEALLEARRRGHDVSALVAGCGIDPAVLERPDGRVSAHAYARLWLASAALLDDEFFGMNRRRMKVGSFAFMAETAREAANLGEALERVLRVLRLVTDDFSPRLMVGNGRAEILLDEPEGHAARPFAYFTFWMLVHGLACWLAGRHLPILGIDLRCAAPDYLEDYRIKFSPNLRFERPSSRLLLRVDGLDQPVRRSEAELRRFLAGAPANILVRYRDPQSLAARIKAHLRAQRADAWPDMEALSAQLCMAPSTLRRKLSLEGQAYQALKDQVRRDLAIGRLDAEAVDYDGLALELGFADASAFYKAFKKWTGSTPGQYRAQLRGEG